MKNKKFPKLLFGLGFLLFFGLGFMIYGQADFKNVDDFISNSFYKIAGLVVSDLEEAEEENSKSGMGKTDDKKDDTENKQEKKVESKVSDSEELGRETVEKENIKDEIINEVLVEELAIAENETIVERNETMVNETVEDKTLTDETLINETLINTTLTNETIIEENISIKENETLINETVINETILNETTVDEILVNQSDLNISTFQYKAVIGRPVKWIKTIDVSDAEKLIIELPKNAENISVLTDGEITEALNDIEEYEDVVEKLDRNDLFDGILTGNVVLDIRKSNGILVGFWGWLTDWTISGNVILEESFEEKISETDNSTIVNLTEVVKGKNEVAIEYYTEAPVSSEENISDGKRIIISAPDEFGYEDILAYTELPYDVAESSIKFYHVVDEQRVLVEFVSYDLDSDGFIDYIEWIVPHLSEQIYELIIEITKAEHLDENRGFVSDIYDSVKTLDGNWSETINDGEYVRVTFEQNLTSERDITIYARGSCATGNGSVVVNGTEIPCDIYLKKKRIDEIREELDG